VAAIQMKISYLGNTNYSIKYTYSGNEHDDDIEMEDNDVHIQDDSNLASSEGEGEDILENMEK
jgi:hypothetical protein